MAFRISLAGADVSFACDDSQTILDAALNAGIELPYACRKGICGNCAGQVSSASVKGRGGVAVSNEFCNPDQVLYCRSVPTADLEIAPISWRRTETLGRKSLTVKVHKNQLAAPDVSVLQLRLPAGQRVKFKAGQHLRIAVTENLSRYYSMANPPQESDSITLHVRHVPGGFFTSRVGQLVPGDTLKIELPFGDFSPHHAEDRHLVFVAGGTGFAPIKSIIDDLMKRQVQTRMTLIWGARSADGLYMLSAVETWKRNWPDFHFIAVVSGEETHRVPGSFAGRVDEALQMHFASLASHAVYCCGSPAMVTSVLRQAEALSLGASNFHSDVFVEAADAPGYSGLQVDESCEPEKIWSA
jgi:NAD(P)H-flavin reductase/ferredoxin